MQQDAEKLPIFYKESALSKAILSGAVLAALTVWFTWDSWHAPIKMIPHLIGMVCGPLLIGLFLAFMVGAIRLVVTNRPAFELTRNGGTYTPIVGKTKQYPWSHVGSVTVREQPVYRNKPQTLLEVTSGGASPKTLISVEAKKLDLSIADTTSLLEAFAQAHAGGSSEFAVHDHRPAPRSTSVTRSFGSWVLGSFILMAISAGGKLACREANKAVVGVQRDAYADTQLAKFDELADASPLMQAIKKSDPKEYERFHQSLRQSMHDNLTQEELETQFAGFTKQLLQRHLTHAPPEALKRYMQGRYDFYKDMYYVSPEALYASLSTGKIDNGILAEGDREKLQALQQKFVSGSGYGIGIVLTTRESDKPLRQNKELIQRRLSQINQRLTDEDRNAFDNESKPGLDHNAYCKAVLHLYRECLTLPAEEVVMVFRALHELPEDDRATAP